MTRADGQDMSGDALAPLTQEALDWLVFLKSGLATPEDADAFSRWRSQSLENEAAFRDAVRMRRGLQTLLQIDTGQRVIPLPRREFGLSRRALFTGGGAIPASMAGVWVARHPPLDLWPSYAELTADYRTDTGQRQILAPVTGVSVEMNTRTSIARGRDATSLEMVAGEAFVSVKRPSGFITKAGNGEIVASGADFNLRYLETETCVTCVAGKLEVRHRDQRLSIGAGQQLTYMLNSTGPVIPANQTSNATSWREGLLVFRGETLSRVVEEINRYQAGRLILTDKTLGRYPINAVFHLDQIDNAAAQITQLLDVKATRLPGGMILIG